jgi:putative Ig domain-containing protein
MFQAGSHTTTPTAAVTIAVTPGTATVIAGASRQFTATVTNTSNVGSTWSASSGKISATGMFTAPSVTTSTTVTVTAISQADSTKQATATIFVTPTGTPLAVQTSALPSATTGTAYLEALIASGGEAPYRWSLSSGTLPQGIQIAANGAIGGTTSASGSFSFTVLATDALSHTATSQLTLAVANQTAPLEVQTVTLPNATAGTSYADTLAASGGQAPYRWSLTSGSLPTGIQLTSSGSISGTASAAGSYSFIVQATDAASNTSTRQLALAVAAQSIPLAVQTSALPDATVGTAYAETLAASGGQAPYQWSVTAGALPQGFQLDASTGAVGGTTNATGSFNFTITAKDAASHTATRQLTLVALAGEGSQPVIPSTFFGLQSMVVGGTYPTVSFGSYRLWDGDVAWNTLNPSAGTYNFQNIDGILGQLKTHGLSDGVIYTFGLVPNWASSAPTDAACDLQALGGCDLPTDLNADGTGTNQTFINFVQNLAEHVNSATYLQTHAHVKYWEPWNEWYRDPVLSVYNQGCIAAQSCSIRATYAQMVRMTEDLRCVVTGTGSVNGVPCSRTAIDASAKILTPASHGRSSFGVSVMENFLHCDSKPQASALCTTGDRGRNAIDILNFHFYAMLTETAEEIPFHVSNIKAGLHSADLAAMPLWSSEGGWGFDTSLSDPDLQEAFLVRYFLLGWSSGISRLTWYEFENSGWGTLYSPQTHGSLTEAGLAYQQVYSWLAGNSMPQACTGPTYPAVGVWTCAVTTPSGTNMLAVWDSSQSCSDGVCTTSLYSQNPIYSSYVGLNGKKTAVTVGSVAIGAKPILLIQ